MLKKFLTEVIVSIVGKPGEELVNLLDDKKYVNEFLIAKKLDLTINQTRNILYKISDYGLVSSIRKKDKKKGWYTYFWKIEVLKSLYFLEALLNKRVTELINQIKSRTEKQFYFCERCNVEVTEEKALMNDFTCNECGGLYSLKDNSPIIKSLEKEKTRFDKQLEMVEEEITKEKEKIEKSQIRKIKKEEKEKAEKRRLKRELVKKLKEKEAKKKMTKKKSPAKKKAPKKKLTKKSAAKKSTPKKKIKKKPASRSRKK